jgi:hypothetical protein
MSDSATRTAKERAQIETELLEILRQRQHDWTTASDVHRDHARQRFMDALQRFNALVLYGKPPQAE